MTMPVRVLVADDQALIRVGLCGILESEPGIEVAGEVADGAAAIRAVRAGGIDVVLMDLRMPGVDGVEATRQITAGSPGVAVLILTTFEGDDDVLAAVAAGARGYLGKDAAPETLLDAIRIVARGQTLLSPRAMSALATRATQRPPRPAPTPPSLGALTERELEIATLVARGLSNDEIAQHLVISPATAKTHINRAMAKIGARDRAALVVAVYTAGLLD